MPSEQAEPMRPVFTCVACGCVYMPPKSMAYPHLGLTASPLHCSEAACRRAVAQLPRQLQALCAKAAWSQAKTWTAKTSTPATAHPRHRHRPASRPEGSRSKLR
ncbi:hypothetical protein [Streptomyces sp. NPDC051162]|uniref:hypothetical protein n=1 Tax=Streptomyces sp. NPDC051162 TaxID=3154747 RepID=UPI00342C0DAA